MSDPKDVFKQVLEDELRKIAPGASAEPHIERPKNPEHGDLSTNVALQLAKSLGLKPRDIAQKLLKGTEAALVEKGITSPGGVSIAGPGFLNVRVSTGSKLGQIAEVLKLGRRYGCGQALGPGKNPG
jgi:arginyl-tRNA synthetase